MSHFLRIQTQIREREFLLAALRDLHYEHQVSDRENLVVRGYGSNTERAEILVETGSPYDIGFHRQNENYSVLADWWGVERNSAFRQAEFIRQVNHRYAYNVIRDHIAVEGLIQESEVHLPNGDTVMIVSEKI